MNLQPSLLRSVSLSASLATFLRNFFSQYSTFVFGLDACSQEGWRCQKHPCTKMTDQYFGNTMSGLPGRSLRWRRKRNPSPWAMRRTTSSGFVSRLPIRDIISLRFLRSTVSVIAKSTPRLAKVSIQMGVIYLSTPKICMNKVLIINMQPKCQECSCFRVSRVGF